MVRGPWIGVPKTPPPLLFTKIARGKANKTPGSRSSDLHGFCLDDLAHRLLGKYEGFLRKEALGGFEVAQHACRKTGDGLLVFARRTTNKQKSHHAVPHHG